MFIAKVQALIFVLFLGVSAQALGPNDLSVLMPLPKQSEFALMLGTEGDVLLPKKNYASLPQRIVIGQDPQWVYENLKVVGVRIDPCFTEGEGPRPCHRQVRMVWQPILFGARGGAPTTIDASIHSFYDFTESAWAEFLKEWKTLSTSDAMEALQVHPRLKAEGYQGPLWTKMRQALLKHCGPQNLVRATVMTVNPMQNVWVFIGVDYLADEAKNIQIPRLSHIAQAFFADLGNVQEFRTRMNPYPQQEIEWLNFLADSVQLKEVVDEETIRKAVGRAIEFENPRLQNPGTVDCASCHIAHTVRQWGEKHYPTWQKDFVDVRFASRFNLENRSTPSIGSNRLRAFGYFRDEPILSQRVINETAMILEAGL